MIEPIDQNLRRLLDAIPYEPVETSFFEKVTRALFRFPNEYGASVVQGGMSYGGHDGLWELAVIAFDGDDWKHAKVPSITRDVLGWLSETEVAEALQRIETLPERIKK